ncbi:hypothetical protein [Cupriavidus nantongensis]|uniref:hypothetical protein n=1 Tax=Cupriavidus nantongensis TaxID=1796606 RepID=UPI0035900843
MDARIQRRLRACIGAMMLAPAGVAFGAMEDGLLSADPVGAAARGYYAEPAYDMGTHYQGGHLRLGYKLSPDWSLEAGYWRRHVSHGDDAAGIGRKLTLRLPAWANYTGNPRKSGAMLGNKLAGYSIAHPNDTQLQADLIYTGRRWPGQVLTGFIGGGFQLNAADVGIDAGSSFNDGSAFVGAGGSWRWGLGAWSLTAGYHVQYFFRELDNRYMAYGSARTPFNQTVLLQAAYAVNRHVDVFVRGQGAHNSLMGYVPTLYNPVSASRLDGTYGMLSIGLRVRGF